VEVLSGNSHSVSPELELFFDRPTLRQTVCMTSHHNVLGIRDYHVIVVFQCNRECGSQTIRVLINAIEAGVAEMHWPTGNGRYHTH